MTRDKSRVGEPEEPQLESTSMSAAQVIDIAPRVRSAAWMIERTLEGDRHAGEALYERLQPIVNRLIWRLLGADAEHHDVVNEAFAQILKNLGRLREPERLDAWAAKIAVNTVRKEIRRRRYRRIVSFSSPQVDVAPGPPNQSSDLIGKHIQGLLNRLPADDRILIVLHYVEGYKLHELVEIHGMSLATLKRRLARARRSLCAKARKDSVVAGSLGMPHED